MKNIARLLAEKTGLLEPRILHIASSAPVRYKTYSIDKRGGGKRRISQPAREVKLLQRALTEVLLNNLPVHDSATAYVRGKSIYDNATPHRGNGPIIKMDFSDFFPSLRKLDWVAYCNETRCLEEAADIELTSQILFQKQPGYAGLRLAIGAPSSPALSNILLYEFDTKVCAAFSGKKITYTRYADDLTFSAPRTGYMHHVRKEVQSIVGSLKFPRLSINAEKTHYVTPKYRRTVTGLILATDGKVTVGHARKRQLHAAVHQASLGRLDSKQLQSLSGMLAFVHSVEPQFIQVLSRKYGDDTVEMIQKHVIKKKAS